MAKKRLSGSRFARGYTLMEIAIVMAVLGILLAAFTGAYNIYAREKARSLTIANADEIMDAMNRYVMQNGHYPCPAPLNVSYTDATYGVASTACEAGTGALGSFTGGLYTEQGNRADAILTDPEAGTETTTPRVKRGAVPFRTLGLAEKYAYDGYDMRYLYAVTENLAVRGRFVANAGGVGVYRGSSTASSASIVQPEYSAHFILFSAGPNRMGGYNRYGREPAACATGTIDWQNCNTSTSATNRLSRYAVAPYSIVRGAEYYDDYVRFYTATELPAWRVSGDTGMNIRDSVNAEYGGAMGVGDTKPTEALVVRGDAALNTSNNASAFAGKVCNADGSECYTVPTAPGSDFDCPTGEYLVGFEGGRAKCAALSASAGSVRCPAGQYVTSINGSGNLVCGGTATPLGCPRKAVDLCYNEDSAEWTRPALASQTNGGTRTVTGGFNRSETYRCNAGEWELQSSSGQCACTPVAAEERFYSCDRGFYLDNSTWPVPGGRYTGSIRATFTRTCGATPAETETVASNTCQCDASVQTKETRVVPCANGGNSYVQERTWSCPTTTAGQWSAWTNVTSPSVCNSSCTARPEVQNLSCPVGYTSTSSTIAIRRERQLLASCTWLPWVETFNNCTNCTGAIQVRNIGCDGSVGSRLQARTFSCGSPGQFGSWSTLNSSCSAAINERWRANDTSSKRVSDADRPPGYFELNTSCPTSGQKGTCYYPAGGGMNWELNCTCE